MAAVDAPPGVAFAGQAAGEFVARPRARRLARRMFFYVVAISAMTLLIAARRIYSPMVEFALVAPLMCVSIAAVGYAVRAARIRVDGAGVRWGWRWAGFRMRRERMKQVHSYADAFALTPQRGSTWYLSSRDWDHFERVPKALRRARIPFARHPGRAPLRARLQSYGIVLDVLLVVNALAMTLALGFAILL